MSDGLAAPDLAAVTSGLVSGLHNLVDALEALYPGRKFTPDGHLVGSLGEVAAATLFDLTLHKASHKGCDAVTADGRMVEIKATYGTRSVGVRRSSNEIADALIVLRLSRHDSPEVVYNGSYALAHTLIKDKPVTSNGQVSMSLARLRELNDRVPDADRVPERSGPTAAGTPGKPSPHEPS
jgi:hypothetical protein